MKEKIQCPFCPLPAENLKQLGMHIQLRHRDCRDDTFYTQSEVDKMLEKQLREIWEYMWGITIIDGKNENNYSMYREALDWKLKEMSKKLSNFKTK